MGFISAISTKIKINRIPPRINFIMKSLIDSISLAASGHILFKKVTIKKKKQNFKFLKNPLFFHNISKMTTDTYKSVWIKNLGIFLTNNLVFMFFSVKQKLAEIWLFKERVAAQSQPLLSPLTLHRFRKRFFTIYCNEGCCSSLNYLYNGFL